MPVTINQSKLNQSQCLSSRVS